MPYYKGNIILSTISGPIFFSLVHSWPLFLHFRLSKTVSLQLVVAKYTNDWIGSAVQWRQKQPLYQLRHTHCQWPIWWNNEKTEEAEVSPILKKCLKNKCYSGTVVVVQLSERLLPIPEDPGSNSAISNFDWTYLLFTVCWKEKMGRRLGITFESQRCQSMRILLLEFYDRSVSRFFPLCQCDQIWRNF